MPPPSNTTFLTAIDLAPLPASVSQNVHDAGTTYPVWYKYTAAADERLLLVFGRGDLVVYRPTIEVWVLQAGVPVDYPLSAGIFTQNKAIQIPLTPGETYYISFTPNAGNPSPSVLTLDAEIGARSVVTAPALFINDDTDGYPGIFVSITTGKVLNAITPFPAGEAGDYLPGVGYLFADAWNGNLKRYNETFDLQQTIAFTVGFNPSIRSQRTLNRWYAGRGTNPAQIRAYNPDGTLQASFSLTGNSSLTGLAANNDGTILYHTRGGPNNAIRRWDIVGSANLADLAAGVSGFIAGFDILVLPDGTILASYIRSTNGEFQVRRYTDAGVLQQTYAIAATSRLPAFTNPRLAYDPTDPGGAFWVWFHDDVVPGTSIFKQIRVSDGVVLQTVPAVTEYETGVYGPAETLTPLDRSGISFSCPFVVIGAPLDTTTLTPGPNSSFTNTDQSIIVVASSPPVDEGCPLPLPPDTGGGAGCSVQMGLPPDSGGGSAQIGY